MILNVWLHLIFLTDYCLSKNKCNREEMEEVTLLSNTSTFAEQLIQN